MRTVRLGDVVTLPSGVEARITAAADPLSPWRTVFAGEVSLLFRAATSEDGQPLVQFFGGNEKPTQFSADDGAALADLLNRAKPATFR